ncbi:3-carboxy-cis,cis-muconate cycloisomerase [Microbacterium pseudoresistens]|uniref:3-carboxy-cis,cis-muconate cycloisomerase n=1 Tax=Microbacterium pseudoresistens TaxID=640634 RepID=A0A7Y9JMZ8_9MICO|nr:lyase family protein [Microbacterium pseudoresistens]NYD54895.1 3-carboxy-cis,cis-muconate cycloisomerase [Microbacterium pseudoresistens]
MRSRTESPALDHGLLSPVTTGFDEAVTDAAIRDALVGTEAALARAWAKVGAAPTELADAISNAFARRDDIARAVDLDALARAAVAGGNPVIPLVGMLRSAVPAEAREWVHRGATSQDILDSALMVVAQQAAGETVAVLRDAETAVAALAEAHRNDVGAARSLTQHGVPTTFGLRAANWLRGMKRAAGRLEQLAADLPAQLGGAGGTLASFVQIGGSAGAARLPAAFAAELGLAVPHAPWHTTRWPVTELGDALVQVLDALGVIAADVATLSRTEIGEAHEHAAGGSSAMPQKQNPTAAVLIRSAAVRAPHLAATLHTASALAVDERPDGSWHAEWPALRELSRLALGASGTARRLLEGLRVDSDAIARNLRMTGSLIVAERVSIALGEEAATALIEAARAGTDVTAALAPYAASAGLDVHELLDPAEYLGFASSLIDSALEEE